VNSSIATDQKARLLSQAMLISGLGLVPMSQGNLSLRDPESGLVVITPHDYPYEFMTIDDLVVVDLDGNVIEGSRLPSSETPVHCMVYQKRPQIFGIVHSEPIMTNVFGVISKPILPVFVNMAIDVRGVVPIMEFAASGTKDFGCRMLDVMGKNYAVIWANHGLLTIGETIEKAVHCTVMVEANAKIYYYALQLGDPIVISQDVIDHLVG